MYLMLTWIVASEMLYQMVVGWSSGLLMHAVVVHAGVDRLD